MENRVIYLVRHGKIQLEDDQRRYIGQIDLPLAQVGRQQARAMRQRFGGAELGAVVCSDLGRARETAEIIAEGSGLAVAARPDLREVSMGEWEGLTFREVAHRFPEAYQARGKDIAQFRVAGGESFADCGRRAVAAFEDLFRSTTGNLLVVGHAGVNRLLLCHVLGMPVEHLFRLGQDYACLNIIQGGSSGFQVRLVNGSGRASRR